MLAGILPNRIDLLYTALAKLSEAHFADAHQRALWQMLERYADVTGSVLSTQALHDLLHDRVDAGNLALYVELHRSLCSTEVTDDDFIWAVAWLQEQAAAQATHTALMESMEVLTRGLTVGKHDLHGHSDARSYLLTRLSRIERELHMQDAPEGDMRHEGGEVMSEYVERKVSRAAGPSGVRFGVSRIDELTGGLQPGELDLVVAYSSEGKTSLCIQLAWHAAVRQGLNVYFATSETLRGQVRRKIVSRHSLEPQFGLDEGLNSRDLKAGALSDRQERVLQDVVNDLGSNDAYGKLYLAQVPRGTTISELESRVHRAHASWRVDLIIVDYLALLKSERYRDNSYQELSETIKSAKQLAATFDNGAGVPLVSPWQTNRTKYEQAQQSGYYTLQALSETAEAEKSSDVIISLLRQHADESRVAELRCQVLKNRDGERSSGISLDIDYATCSVRERRAAVSFDALVSV